MDDRTGFPTRAERTKKEWNNLIVGDRFWEERQPQDLVKGVPDFQAVPDPRPLAPAAYVGPQDISISAPAGPGATALVLATTAGLAVGTPVGVVLDDGTVQRTTVASVDSDGVTVHLTAPLVGFAGSNPSAPNLLYNYAPEPVLELPRNFAAGQ